MGLAIVRPFSITDRKATIGFVTGLKSRIIRKYKGTDSTGQRAPDVNVNTMLSNPIINCILNGNNRTR